MTPEHLVRRITALVASSMLEAGTDRSALSARGGPKRSA